MAKSKAKTEMEILDLPGVGPSTAKKLSKNGYSSVVAIGVAAVNELSAIGSIGEKTAQKIINTARESLDLNFKSADEVLETRRELDRISTGSSNLDNLFGGGVETGSITELYGEYRSGKTQLAHQICVCAQLPKDQGGLVGEDEDEEDIKIVYVDTEGTFRPERIVSMTQRYEELEVENVLNNIKVGRAFNSDHQIALVDKVARQLASENIRILIVDSLISHFRAEYIGRGTLAARQQKLNQHIHALLRIAEIGSVAVLVTNQVHAKPDVFFGDPTAPVGGNIVAHASQTRTYLRKSKGSRRIARIADSPLLPESEAVFTINEQGIMDS